MKKFFLIHQMNQDHITVKLFSGDMYSKIKFITKEVVLVHSNIQDHITVKLFLLAICSKIEFIFATVS